MPSVGTAQLLSTEQSSTWHMIIHTIQRVTCKHFCVNVTHQARPGPIMTSFGTAPLLPSRAKLYLVYIIHTIQRVTCKHKLTYNSKSDVQAQTYLAACMVYWTRGCMIVESLLAVDLHVLRVATIFFPKHWYGLLVLCKGHVPYHSPQTWVIRKFLNNRSQQYSQVSWCFHPSGIPLSIPCPAADSVFVRSDHHRTARFAGGWFFVDCHPHRFRLWSLHLRARVSIYTIICTNIYYLLHNIG